MGKGMKKEVEGKAAPAKNTRPPRPVQGRALNRWDPEAERDLIMACLTSENNNYPTINWPRVKVIMDDLGYKFSRSALDQRWSKKIMKDWRERHHGSSGTDFADPTTPNQTPGRKRGRVIAAARARADAAILATREMDQAHQDDYAEDDDDDYELREKKPAAKRARTTQPQGRDVVIIGDDEAVGDEPVNPNHNPEAKVGLMMPPSAYLNNNGQGLKQTGSEDSKDSVGLMNAPAHPSYGGGPQYGGLTPYNPVPPSPGRNGYAAPAYNNTNAYGPFTGNGYPNAGYDMGNQGPLGYNMHGNQGFTAQSPGSAYARPTNSFGFSPQANLEKNSNEDTEASDDVIFKRSRSVTMAPKPEGM